MIRLYNEEDFYDAESLLKEEGVNKNALQKPDGETFVLDNNGEIEGLFTVCYRSRMAILIHFVVKKDFRRFGAIRALNLVRYMDRLIKDYGFKEFIINLANKRSTTCSIVDRYFKDRIKDIKNLSSGKKFYLVRVLP
jgi:hypothetical protein